MNAPATPQTLDVTGLPPAAVAAVAAVVEQLRAVQARPQPANPVHRPNETHEEWVARYDAWVASHVSRNPSLDDSRESMYD